MRRAQLLAGAAVALGLVLPTGADAAGATYDVVYCDPLNRGLGDVTVREPHGYRITRLCDNADGENSVQVNSVLSPAVRGSEARVFWRAPAQLGIIGARVDAKLRRDAGHQSRLYLADGQGRETKRIATGDGSPSPFKPFNWNGARQTMFVASLRCESGPSCPESGQAKTWIRHLRLRVADYADPEVSIASTLLASGWRRGEHDLSYRGEDDGSGVQRVYVKVNGNELSALAGACWAAIPGSDQAARMQPCSSEPQGGAATADTASSPFHPGSNTVAVCAVDFAGNETCDPRTVQVDNIPPALGFTNAQDPDDPELIQAVVSDQHSGVASGEIYYRAAGDEDWLPMHTVVSGGALRARVDSAAVPAGTYQFRAVATDVAGNRVETSRRLDGLEKQLEFPLKTGVELNARLEPGGSKRVTVPYGRRAKVAGTLRDASGEPLGNQPLTVVEHFGDGALIRERVSQLITDARGRWQERLPAGPSRRVAVSYAGTQRYLPEQSLGGRLHVRTKATLRASRGRINEGGRVVFRGRLGRLGARIPPGGKLLELQVKQDKRTYQTVGQGFRSSPTGRFKLPYRFGDFYRYDVRFRFRVRVAREADWPYKAPIRSKPETVTVLSR